MTRLSAKEAKRLGILGKESQKSKYRSTKVQINGHTFDSVKEGNRYLELRLLEQAGEIEDLELQPEFVLQEGFIDRTRLCHRPIIYRADFQYREKNGGVVVEDVKGMKTEVYRLKKKMLLKRYKDLDFREI